jgi:hypothetical protein
MSLTVPPSCSTAAMITSRQRVVCTPASPTVDDPSASIGAVPDTRIRLPTRTAREKPIDASNGDPLEARRRTDTPLKRASP